MLLLVLHKRWFHNLVCNLTASCPLTPPKTKPEENKPQKSPWANSVINHLPVEGGTTGFSLCGILALLF